MNYFSPEAELPQLVTNDMIKFGNANFKMTEIAFALEEIVVPLFLIL